MFRCKRNSQVDQAIAFIRLSARVGYVSQISASLFREATTVNVKLSFVVLLAVCTAIPAVADRPAYDDELQKWWEARERSLRADNGWLTLAGRFPLKSGANTFGTGKDNDVIFPPELKGVGPDRLGALHVDAQAKKVKLQLAKGVTMLSGDKPFGGERVFRTDQPDWVGLGRLRMYVIVRSGRYILRLADNESDVRKNFKGRVWYPANAAHKVEATFVPYPTNKTIRVVNVIGEVSNESCPGFAEFKLNGETCKLMRSRRRKGCSSYSGTRRRGKPHILQRGF
jgi:uncharacterized protein (DUF1684 family)